MKLAQLKRLLAVYDMTRGRVLRRSVEKKIAPWELDADQSPLCECSMSFRAAQAIAAQSAGEVSTHDRDDQRGSRDARPRPRYLRDDPDGRCWRQKLGKDREHALQRLTAVLSFTPRFAAAVVPRRTHIKELERSPIGEESLWLAIPGSVEHA